jgi:hypothetical protein
VINTEYTLLTTPKSRPSLRLQIAMLFILRKKTVCISSLLPKTKQNLLFTRLECFLFNDIISQKFGFV